jgi:vacuolar-type H+-ATPase subunit C/Vma6
VTARWEDLATRARGLATHLLGRVELDALARAPDVDALGDALRARGFLSAEGPVTADVLELAVRRVAGARLQILAGWGRERNALLAVVFEDEDRRSLRALLRGAVQGAAPEERLAGLIPTPGLPERALTELAGQPTPGAIAALLTAWGSAYGPAVLPDAAARHPDLLTLEYLLNRTFAARALRGARAARSRGLLEFVRETIDLENACTALVLAGGEPEAPPQPAFVDGGRRLAPAAFCDAAAAPDPGEAARRLAEAFRPAPVAGVFARAASVSSAIEEALLRHRIAAQAAAARLDPAGAASVLSFVLRLRAEVLDLQRVIWGVMLRAPRADIAAALVSA